MGPYIIGVVFLIIFSILSEFNPVFIIFVFGFSIFIAFWQATHGQALNEIGTGFDNMSTRQIRNERERRRALDNVRLFLAPYESIWRNLKVSNKYCIMRLGRDGKTITITEHPTTQKAYKKLTLTSSQIWNSEEMWNRLCMSFDYFTSYEGFKQICDNFQINYMETTVNSPNYEPTTIELKKNSESKNAEPVEKLDINNASEVEITALPGISIVLSKKLIKKREEIGGFKTVEDVFLFLKLKPHMEKQLRNLICVKKMKGRLNIERTKEGSIDL